VLAWEEAYKGEPPGSHGPPQIIGDPTGGRRKLSVSRQGDSNVFTGSPFA
jgi:hypothetical protein